MFDPFSDVVKSAKKLARRLFERCGDSSKTVSREKTSKMERKNAKESMANQRRGFE